MSEYNLFVTYTGSKSPFLNEIYSCFANNCKKYVEPYVGGGGVYFGMSNSRYEEEWLNEWYKPLYTLYQSLIDENTRAMTMEAILNIDKNDDDKIGSKRFEEAKKRMEKGICLEQASIEERVNYAADVYRAYSQSRDCSVNRGYKKSAYKNEELYKKEVRRNVRNAVERLETQPKITNMDGLEVIRECASDENVQLMLDPPYIGMYRISSSLYLKEMPGLAEHIKIVEALKNAKAAVVLCGYRSQIDGVPTIYDTLGDDWKCFKLTDDNCQIAKNGRAKYQDKEFIWVRRVSEYAKYRLSMTDYKENITMEEYWEKIRVAINSNIMPEKHVDEYMKTYMQIYNRRLL